AHLLHGLGNRHELVELLLADDALDHRLAEERLRDLPRPLFRRDALGAVEQLARDARQGDADHRLRLVGAGQVRHQRGADLRGEREGDDEPPHAPPEDGYILEGMKRGRVVHYRILTAESSGAWRSRTRI